MAKQGYSVSQRRKVEAISSGAAFEVKPHDCGTTFIITDNTQRTITLPTAAQAGNGWWARFVLGVTLGNAEDQTIDLPGTATFSSIVRLAGGATPAAGIVGTGGANDQNRTGILFDGSAGDVVGDVIEVMQLNGNFYAYSVSAV